MIMGLTPHARRLLARSERLNRRRQALPLDELHRIEMHAAFAADVVDRDDTGVVQAGRGLGFVLETLQLPGIHRRREGQDLQGDAAAEGALLGFVDDAHAAAADFADDAEIAERLDERVARRIVGRDDVGAAQGRGDGVDQFQTGQALSQRRAKVSMAGQEAGAVGALAGFQEGAVLLQGRRQPGVAARRGAGMVGRGVADRFHGSSPGPERGWDL
jgi:hypothetical protein